MLSYRREVAGLRSSQPLAFHPRIASLIVVVGPQGRLASSGTTWGAASCSRTRRASSFSAARFEPWNVWLRCRIRPLESRPT